MRKTDWAEIIDFYNGVFGTKHTETKTLLEDGYKMFGSIEEFALKIGVSRETLRRKMVEEKVDTSIIAGRK
jgi:predicted enzyme related to lactoylglutathione lyase